MDNGLQDLYRRHFGQLLASITRLTGDMQLAEDSIQDAFVKAAKEWGNERAPAHAVAWLTTTARHCAIDHMRRVSTFNNRLSDVALLEELEHPKSVELSIEDDSAVVSDDMLRLIFTCCHPALHIEARVALCLNTVCGLRTDEIARAFIVTDATMSQRLWRAKTKIRDAGITYKVPDAHEREGRLDSVLAVIYLIFNEGWLPSHGTSGLRVDLAEEAMRLARLIRTLLPQQPNPSALLGFMLIQHSRRLARFDADGQLVLLRDQDRSLWDQRSLKEGLQLIRHIFHAGNGNSRYAIMGAIAATHASAPNTAATDWNEIATLYEHLMTLDPSAVVALNHAVAIGERDGAEAGLQQVMQLADSATMQRYYLFYSTQAEFLRRLKRDREAHAAYSRAIELVENQIEKAFLVSRAQSLKP